MKPAKSRRRHALHSETAVRPPPLPEGYSPRQLELARLVRSGGPLRLAGMSVEDKIETRSDWFEWAGGRVGLTPRGEIDLMRIEGEGR